MTSESVESIAVPRRRNILIRLFTNIWFGVALLTLILIYCAVISALAPVRWTLEMTEMQAFRHWLFVGLVALFMLSLLAVTLFRTPWRWQYLGSHVAHIGLLILCGGALAYFGSKIEGDVLLQAPLIEVRANMGDRPVVIDRFRASAGEVWARSLPGSGEAIRMTVRDVAFSGAQPTSATVDVQQAGEPVRTIKLSDNVNDWQPIVGVLEAHFTAFPSQTRFYDDDEPAFFVRDPSGRQTVLDIPDLPIYRDHYLVADGILNDSQGQPAPPARERPELKLLGLHIPTGWFERWAMPITVPSADLPFTIEITGYVAYVANVEPNPATGGVRPVVAVHEQRRSGVSARAMSAVRVVLRGRGPAAGWSDTQWCMFSLYPEVDARPLTIQPPGAGPWQIIFSRQPHELNATLNARWLGVTYFPGERGIESYHSNVEVQPAAGPAYATTVETNRISKIGPWTLYQSGFAEDQQSYSILGVGNRIGLWAMNIGWITVVLGCLFAFYIKPALLRRSLNATFAAACLFLLLTGCGEKEPYKASQKAVALDPAIDWSRARLLAVQDAGRYKTLDSFARESMTAMTGSEHLPGLSPLASLFDWLFNRDAYVDTPVIRVASEGIRSRILSVCDDATRQRVSASKRFTLRELFNPQIEHVLAELESRPLTRRATGRVREAQAVASRLDELACIIPQPGGDNVAAWYPPQRALANLSDEQLSAMGLSAADLPETARRGIPGLSPAQALDVTVAWSSLRAAWLRGDAAGVQRYLDRLAEFLPTLAATGVYPAKTQLQAEARYYALGKFTWGWALYFLAFLVSVLALVTRWRWPWGLAIVLTVGGLGVHAYGLALRWYILGRIPVANMFEAVVASAWVGICAAVVIELLFRKRVFLVAASLTGFLALVMGGYVLPGAELGTIPKILDDVQLRVHTVMIITSYALIFVAAVIAAVYLIGYFMVAMRREQSAEVALASGGSLTVNGSGNPSGSARLPRWLNDIDWCQMVILHLVFVLLFVGTILGAWWADYSWGRPWGWDPKEVFALSTWIIYAILVHVRMAVRERGLWTAWLSLAGCAMMAFNWFFVNFYIASIHSYV